MKQKDAVYSTIVSAFANAGLTFTEGMDVGPAMKDKALRAYVQSQIEAGFTAGTIDFEPTVSNKEKMSTPAKLSQYVSGLISNWIRKDERLNGNVKYEAKNPGTRVGSTDPQLKALRQLATQFKHDTVKFGEIQNHISNRVSTLQSEKAKSIKVDLSVLPAELIAELGLPTQN
jgi:hypothetical protein